MLAIYKKILQLIVYFSICFFDQYHYFCRASPLIGKDVRLAEKDEFPFIVSLSVNNTELVKKGQEHRCGGSLITRKYVLTAAHCIEGAFYNEVLVKVGSIDLKKAETYEVKWWVTYNEWVDNEVYTQEAGNHCNDVAIITLSSAVSLNMKLGVLAKTADKCLYGRKAVTAGWGLIEKDKRPRYLRTLELNILPPDDSWIKKLNGTIDLIKPYITEKFLYTKSEQPARISIGDSGGPLIVHKREIVGVNVGYCFGEKNQRIHHYQNVHSSVNYYKAFIEDVTKSRPSVVFPVFY